MTNIKILEIKVYAVCGSHIDDCMRDAIKLAADEWCNVRLCLNGQEYLIQPDTWLESCRCTTSN